MKVYSPHSRQHERQQDLVVISGRGSREKSSQRRCHLNRVLGLSFILQISIHLGGQKSHNLLGLGRKLLV